MIKDKKLYRILVIEDNPGDYAIVEDFLSEQISDPLITHAGNFKKASAILSAADAEFDAILLDLTLPDKSGQTLVTEMLALASLCPIIILTGFADIEFSIKSISQGILDYLYKDDLNATTLYKSIVYAIERKKTISELKESEKRYSELFNLSPQPMWVFDPETYRFIQVNKATEELYGYSEEEFMTMTLMDIKQEEDIALAKDNIKKRKPGDGIFRSSLRHHKKSGEIIEVEIYGTPIIINNKSFRSVIAIDVTEKNLYEHKIIKAIIKTQEDERYEIGGELHDNVCQILAASQLFLGMLKDSLEPSKMELFDRCRENISLATNEIRNLSHRLAPAFFDDSTMEEAFKRLFQTFNIEKKMEIFLNFGEEVKACPISLEIQLNAYRILQEQLKNILKYAHATIIEVDVSIINNKFKMMVSDNGVGFNVDKAKEGIGLANMKRRAELFSGKFTVDSSPGNGCVSTIEIPLPEVN
ncbi:MAG: PAS domain S-box protein [Ginsengibacter sp.]